MQFINAISVTSHVRDWVASSRYPRILHIFDNACNLINERREILSIVSPPIGNGPFNLVVEDIVCFSERLSPISSIFVSDSKLTLGNLTIQIADANLWKPRPNWEYLHGNRDKIVHQLMKLSLPTHPLLLPQSLALAPHASAGVSNLSRALANKDLSFALKVTSQLAGLGAGLTPAGDDFIMGAIHAVWIIHPLEVASALTQSIADTAAPLTTSLSAAWLRSAGQGEAGVLWHQFFEVLVGRVDAPTYLQEALDNILSVGETSGADALEGFLSTSTAWATLPNRK